MSGVVPGLRVVSLYDPTMRRRLLTAARLSLSAAACLLWVRSYGAADAIDYCSNGRLVRIGSEWGRLCLARWPVTLPDAGPYFDTHAASPPDAPSPAAAHEWHALGFSGEVLHVDGVGNPSPASTGRTAWRVTVPHGFAALLPALPSLLSLSRRRAGRGFPLSRRG